MDRIRAYLTALRTRGRSVRARLCLIVAAILAAALAVAGWIAYRAAEAQRAQFEQALHDKAREVTATIDREIVTTKSLLTVLASSPFLQAGDTAGFERQAAEVSRRIGIQIVLRDPHADVQLFNTSFPAGPPDARGTSAEMYAAETRAIERREPVVTNVFYGPRIRKNVVAVVTPVIKNGKVDCLLSMGIPTDKFAELLDLESTDPDTIISIVDRNNVIVARSVLHREYSGTPLPSNFAAVASRTAGVWTSYSRHGVLHRWHYRHSIETGWWIGVGVPVSKLTAPLKASLLKLGAAGGLLFAAAMGLAFHIGGRIERSLGVLGIDRNPTREEFAVLFDSAPNGVVVVDSKGRIVLANSAIERMFGYARDELIGRPVEMLMPERLREAHADERRRFAVAPQTRAMAAERTLRGRRKDGGEFPIETGLSPIKTRDGTFTMATVVDVSAREQAAHSLAAAEVERDKLRRRLMQAFEAERLRLAHELHDQTGQSLTAIMLELKGVEHRLDDAGRERLRRLSRQLEQMGKSLHNIAWELRPASIDELGLAVAIENYLSDWSQQTGIGVDFHNRFTSLAAVGDEIRTTLYRVLQEALTNIAKHARQATSVSVIIDCVDDTLQLTIEDDGPGFDAEAMSAGRRDGRGLGVAGMRERLALIGGRLEIESAPGAGTTLFARVPLERTWAAA